MLPLRANEVQWTWLVYVEMFIAGVAAGAYVVAAILEVSGRGRSPVARTAHILSFPLILFAAALLIVDLTRPERFWHMLVMSERLLPILKPWSPMSVGSWLLMLFSGFAFVSYVDTLVLHRLHGSRLGVVWSIIGGVLGLSVATYSGVLLSVTNFPVWATSPEISVVYVATTLVSGASAVLLIHALRGHLDAEVFGLARANVWFTMWWLLTVVVFLVMARGELGGVPLAAIVMAMVLGVVPLALATVRPPRTARGLVLSATLVLLGVILVRYGIVMAPQM